MPAPNISITTVGDAIAGQNYFLQCSASLVDGVVVQPHLRIVGPDGRTLASAVQSVALIHVFSPLVTSDAGHYSCIATLNIPEASITGLQNSAVKTIPQLSKLTLILKVRF